MMTSNDTVNESNIFIQSFLNKNANSKKGGVIIINIEIAGIKLFGQVMIPTPNSEKIPKFDWLK